jgi:uncharacterized protein (DUF1499 family)
MGKGGFMEKIWLGWRLGSVLLIFLFIGCSGTRPSNLGVKDNRLSPCPSSPNCVSSQSEDGKHKIDPILFNSTPAEAVDRLKKVIQGMARTTIVRETPEYLHVEFRTLLGFVDDGEFFVDGNRQVIQLRSASRVGYWDLGVNRRRVESIRREFENP